MVNVTVTSIYPGPGVLHVITASLPWAPYSPSPLTSWPGMVELQSFV
jgi:hypothetical protein